MASRKRSKAGAAAAPAVAGLPVPAPDPEAVELVAAYLEAAGRPFNAQAHVVAEALGVDVPAATAALDALVAAGRARRGGAGHYCLTEGEARPAPETQEKAAVESRKQTERKPRPPRAPRPGMKQLPLFGDG